MFRSARSREGAACAIAIALCASVLIPIACGSRSDVAGLPAFEPDASAADAAEPDGRLDGCPSCRLRGWSCSGPDAGDCCDGLACLLTRATGGAAWFCGGVAAGGMEQGCVEKTNQACRWIETVACAEYGPIGGACGPQAGLLQLRRCDGSCFAPDKLYETYWLRGCPADSAPCGASCEASWAAMLCCD